jgi:hypothetical protein
MAPGAGSDHQEVRRRQGEVGRGEPTADTMLGNDFLLIWVNPRRVAI